MKLFIRLLLFISANFFAPAATRLQAADNIQSTLHISEQCAPIEPIKIKKKLPKAAKSRAKKQHFPKPAERDFNVGLIAVSIFSFFGFFALVMAGILQGGIGAIFLMLSSVTIIIALVIAMLTLIFTKINTKHLDSIQKDRTSMTIAMSLTFSGLSLIFLLIAIATTVGFSGILLWIWLAPIVAWLALLIMAILLRNK